MITRDISLSDCILDLLDNSIDGARRTAAQAGAKDLKGYWAHIEVAKDRFSIKDNCGGISLNDARFYAFHFGRREDAPKDVEGVIGIYGIGMKRAIFKIANKARIDSWHPPDRFRVVIDVETWRNDHKNWDFVIESPIDDSAPGTHITLGDINPTVASSFSDNTFVNELIKTAARDYAFLIQAGFQITINEVVVPNYGYSIKAGEDIAPAVISYTDETGVAVRIVAGIIQELDDEIPNELRPENVERFGWYVVCNDRVVVAADKSSLTVWGNHDFQVWHPQYNGFAGFVFLNAEKDPSKLPWTTTKRQVEASNPTYLRALLQMKEVTQQFITYTNARKIDPVEARKVEKATPTLDLRSAPPRPLMKLPPLAGKAVTRDDVPISYRKPRSEVKEVATALGNFAMSGPEVGRRTFEYFRKMELGK